MVWALKLGVGLMVGLIVCFLFPSKHSVRPFSAAVLGILGAALGAFLAQRVLAIGGPDLTLVSLATAGVGALVFSLLYAVTSH
jgi:uncharacterized membrane protein YeaQ/YmgE (transglycosylase-associated protein family)